MKWEKPDSLEKRPLSGIAVDAAHSEKAMKTEYQGIDLATGERLFYRDLGYQTTNIGEFLAVVEAVKYIIETGFEPAVIYTDSTTALSWFREKRTASNKRNSDLKKAEMFLRAMADPVDRITVGFWNNSRWGETPADFGRK